MRIAIICRSLPWHCQGGMEWHAFDLIRGALQRGHHICLLTTPTKIGESQNSKSALEQEGLERFRDQIEIVDIGKARGGRYSISFFRDAARVVRNRAQSGKIDLVHAQGFGAFAIRRSDLGAVPLVVTIHGTLWSETWLDRRTRRFLSPLQSLQMIWRYKHRFMMIPAYSLMLQRADTLIVDSAFTRAELIRDSPQWTPKIRVVPLGVDPDRFQPVASDEIEKRKRGLCARKTVNLLALGRLEPSKGFRVALEALARCRLKSWRLTIGGEGPERPHLENLVKTLEIKERVDFLGRIPDDQIARVFAEADLFLNPDLTQPAFGLVALEAMTQGTPVLASRVGAMPEVLDAEGGWLVRAGDVEAWQKALEKILKRPERLHAQGKRAQKSAQQRFSLKRMIDNTETVYHETRRVFTPVCIDNTSD